MYSFKCAPLFVFSWYLLRFWFVILYSLYQERAILAKKMPAEKLWLQMHSRFNRNMTISLSVFFQ